MIFRLFASAYSVAEIDRASSTNAATIAAFLPGERHDEVGEQCARIAVRVRGDKSPMRPETAKQFRALGEWNYSSSTASCHESRRQYYWSARMNACPYPLRATAVLSPLIPSIHATPHAVAG